MLRIQPITAQTTFRTVKKSAKMALPNEVETPKPTNEGTDTKANICKANSAKAFLECGSVETFCTPLLSF